MSDITPSRAPDSGDAPKRRSIGGRILKWLVGGVAALAIAAALVVGIGLAVAYPQLPDVRGLADYHPKLPLRIYSSDGMLIGEYGDERRSFVPIAQIPLVMREAILSVEDARFYEHQGVDYIGMGRAVLAQFNSFKSQGGSTITMQVARNFYLSSERTFMRKFYEILLAMRIEHTLSKDQILEIYMNQIFLGHRAYGFAAASQTYFGKDIKDVTLAEAAMLAGLPKAPSAYNPINNPKRARERQLYILDRMQENGYITQEQRTAAAAEPIRIAKADATDIHGEYASEAARQAIVAQYGAEAYTRGLNVYTTIRATDQQAAYQALRRGLMNYERRQFYRGPEQYVTLPADPDARDDAIDAALSDHPDNGDLLSAVVVSAAPREVVVMRGDNEKITITGSGLRSVQTALSPRAQPNIQLRPGAVVRIVKRSDGSGWDITQQPQVEGAFVSMDPKSGAVYAMVGGFDFAKNKYNHVTQAWRQPGSTFKPFIYSAALEKGFTANTVINDAPIFFDAPPGGKAWEPKNYSGNYAGPVPLWNALAHSRNIPSVRILQAISPQYAQQWISRFGFAPDKHPAYLTMALGAGSVTPMQMASGYAVFANGGYRVNPYLIARVTDARGKILADVTPPPISESQRAIPERNAFAMDSLLQQVMQRGTGASATAALGRRDIYGKTGTTNDSLDAWFVGFNPTLVAAVWIGYDSPKQLGSRETGGGLALPVWIDYMRTAIKGVPQEPIAPVPGVTNVYGQWVYDEYADGQGVNSLGGGAVPAPGDPNAPAENPAPQDVAPLQQQEQSRIIDLFKQ